MATLKLVDLSFLICISFLFGCASAKEELAILNEVAPLHKVDEVKLKGCFEDVISIITSEFQMDTNIDIFYRSNIGQKLLLQFEEADSTFDLRNLAVFRSKEPFDNAKEVLSVNYVLHYIQERKTPSFKHRGKYAELIGNFTLVFNQQGKGIVSIRVEPRDLQIKGVFDCSLFHGLNCGKTANRVANAPFEESLILNYVKFLLTIKNLESDIL